VTLRKTLHALLLWFLLAAPVAAQHHQRSPSHDEHRSSAQQPATQKPADPQHAPAAGQEHAGHDMPADALPPFIPVLTDADRAAAFPGALEGHTVHDHAVNYFVLFDQFEWQTGNGARGASWDTKGWIGQDVNRFWFRTEGESESGHLEEGEAHFMYGRAISRWWDVVAGVRQDLDPGPSQTWAAVGIQGLAPQWFEVEATAYVGEAGRTRFRFETEYELLLTNRLVLQPLVEIELQGKDDPERGVGSGLSSLETGLRLRYEFKREWAPYVGVVWDRKFFGTADYAEAAGDSKSSAKFVFGVRFWR
jgi:copper resistance protein B